MSRTLRAWLLYAACVLVAAAGLAAVTRAALETERAALEARGQAARDQAVRVALYRMDSLLAPLVSLEAARPVVDYLKPSNPASPAGDLSEFRPPRAPFVREHFELWEDGTRATSEEPEAQIASVGSLLDYAALRSGVWSLELGAAGTAATLWTQAPLATDWSNRTTSNVLLQNQAVQQLAAPPQMRPGMMVPVWSERRLLLVRRIETASGERLQGCRLDWEALRAYLQRSVSDLLPQAELAPVVQPAKTDPERRLAALPVELRPGPLRMEAGERVSPLILALALAWACGTAAAAAGGVLLGASLSLSERRAAFVSAVTHEMRTPLTTFRLYADLLAEGRVEGDDRRQRYYDTLRAEAIRLGHLVENVLAYARLERNRAPSALEAVRARDALDRVADSLAQRATQAGRELAFEGDEEALSATLHIDPAAFERILMNLVDNACKHGAPAREPVIRIGVAREGRWLDIRVADSGPGVPKEAARRLFRAFGRSARDAAGAAPGIGLGLALSRRLARRMRGDLYLRAACTDGACFTLRLPGYAAPDSKT